jgi:TM2 domain-containing membrane protein YozV
MEPRANTLAGLASFFIPGLGQLCTGRVFAAMFWFIVVIIGYVCLIVPGLLLHVAGIVDASQS